MIYDLVHRHYSTKTLLWAQGDVTRAKGVGSEVLWYRTEKYNT